MLDQAAHPYLGSLHVTFSLKGIGQLDSRHARLRSATPQTSQRGIFPLFLPHNGTLGNIEVWFATTVDRSEEGIGARI